MTITIDLPLEIETKIKTQALKDGLNLADYIQTIIRETAEKRERTDVMSEKSFREILAPIHKGFEESGMNDEEIIEMFEQAREEVWQEQQRSK